MDTQTTASTLYPDPAATPAVRTPDAACESSHQATQRLAAGLYPEPVAKPIDRAPNETIAALRASEGRGPGALYRDDQQMGNAPKELALAVDPTIGSEALEGQASIVSSILTDVGMSRDDISQLASFAAAFAKDKPTEDELAAHARTALKELREKHGNDGFEDAFNGARALAKRDPRIANFLTETGLGSHPWVVARFDELARTERNAKTLRK